MVCELDLNQPKGAKSVPVWGVAAGLGGWREVLALLWYLLQAAEHTGIPWGHFRQGRLDTQPPGKADSISFVSLGPVAVPPPRHGQSEAQVGSARVGVTPLPTLAVLPGALPDGVSLIDSSISGQRINCI